jgi:hypothetical protein
VTDTELPPPAQVEFGGPALLHRSRIEVPPACRLVVGPGTVVSGSHLRLQPDATGTVRLPAHAVILDSRLEGRLQGPGEGSLLYRVFAEDDLDVGAEEVQASLFLRDGRCLPARHALEHDSAAVNPRTGRRRAEDALAGGFSQETLLRDGLLDHARQEAALATLQSALAR